MKTLTLRTERQSQLVDVTRLVQEAVAGEQGSAVLVYVPHTTAGVTINEHADPMVARDFVATFSRELEPEDRLWMLEVFYAGGTATRDFSSADIVAEIASLGTNAEFAPTRERLVARIAEEAQPGDLVLVMAHIGGFISGVAMTFLFRGQSDSTTTA